MASTGKGQVLLQSSQKMRFPNSKVKKELLGIISTSHRDRNSHWLLDNIKKNP